MDYHLTESISVIIPVFNSEAVIGNCVAALLKSTVLPSEIILVDDASTDNTWTVIQKLAAQHSLIKAIHLAKNSGPAKARNFGSLEAKGEYLFFLDSDTQILADALACFLKQIKTCDAVVGMYDERPINSDSLSAWYKSLLYAYLHKRSGVQCYDQFSASCAGIKRSVYQQVGGYSEWFRTGIDFENEELGHRINAQYNMVLDPAVKAAHIFPGYKKMTTTFFKRTALWVEMFVVRRKFNSSTNSSGTGISTMALLGAILFFSLGFFIPYGYIPAVLCYLIYLYGYAGFFGFVIKRYPGQFFSLCLLNHYYSLIISLGACFGMVRVITGRSEIFQHFQDMNETRIN